MVESGRCRNSLRGSSAHDWTEMLTGSDNVIQVRIEKLAQLFSSLDPFPFRERDLDKDAEEFIVDWARELRSTRPIAIVIHLPAMEAAAADAVDLCTAINRYFDYRAGIISLDLNELFRIGRRSLAIGLVVLAGCFIANHLVSGFVESSNLGKFIQEGLIILGWVANWKPIENFLYDWWPLAKRRDLYRNLARASVQLRPDSGPQPQYGRDDVLGRN